MSNNIIKRILFLTIFVVLLSSFVLGEELEKKTIIDSWIKHVHNFTYEGDLFQITSSQLDYYQDNTYADARISIFKNGKSIKLVQFGQCVEDDYYEICFQNATIENNLIDNSVFNSLIPSIKVSIKEFVYNDSLIYDRNVSLKDVYIGDIVEVKINLTNNGTFNFYNFTLNEIIGTEFLILNKSDDLILTLNGLKLDTKLETGQSKIYTYSLKLIYWSNQSQITSKINYKTIQSNNRFMKDQIYGFNMLGEPPIVEDPIEENISMENESNADENGNDQEENSSVNNYDDIEISEGFEDEKIDYKNLNFAQRLVLLIKSFFK